uniref:Store-operated calcium entry-associated regulatory factor n=1 Tax=Arcella intermedia TaxID=1963864 RepID=A0A6B2LK43_9EUKA
MVILVVGLNLVGSSEDEFSKVRLDSLSGLRLRWDVKSVGRNRAPQAQLECVGTCWRKNIHEAYCEPEGLDEEYKMKWYCEAEFPDSLDFEDYWVDCEGWDFGGDMFIVEGSCVMKYKLKVVPSRLGRLAAFFRYVLYVFGLLVVFMVLFTISVGLYICNFVFEDYFHDESFTSHEMIRSQAKDEENNSSK